MAVIDADLQHDETQLPKMLALLQSNAAELVVGSRYVDGGSAESFDSGRLRGQCCGDDAGQATAGHQDRRPDERFFYDPARSLRIARAIAGARLQDPTRHRRDRARATAHRRGAVRVRHAPAWRASSTPWSRWIFFGLVLAKLTRDLVSLRFLLFALVGTVGLAVQY